MSRLLEKIATCILEGDAEQTSKLVKKALDDGLPPSEIMDNGLLVGMTEVGVRFRAGDMFVPEVLMSAEAMQAGTTLLRPLLVGAGARQVGKVLLGTVKGDLHDIGKNLVAMMLASTPILRSSSRPSRSISRRSSACPPCSPQPCAPWATRSRPWKRLACVTG
jgi:5-methyltetrahydrofolate--homocysteine methyltransferase